MDIRIARRGVTAVTFPADDVVFGQRVREVLESDQRTSPDGLRSLIEERLRAIHPEVTAHRRDAMAEFGGEKLYVYRDGGFRGRTGSHEWTNDPSTARVITDTHGTYIDANDAAARLFGVPRTDIIGAAAGTFTRPDARVHDAAALWRAVESGGTLHSSALLACRDGREEQVEFVTIKDGAGTGRHVTYLRPSR